jgi:chromosome segregation ATPase
MDRLSKENFDLKLKVMFLSDRLDKLSEESVKHMISENVDLRTNLAVLQQDNKVLRRRVKELQKRLKEERGRPGTAKSSQSDDSQQSRDREQEIIFLREQLKEHVTEIERLKTDNLNREAEKRRMSEQLRILGQKAGDHMGQALERADEAEVYKDLLEQETARREQADEDNRRLRQESEQLRHENAELRREVSAQTSMLTSRNREKERLYQEIEDLKMAQRRGDPAPSTIDSILERSASRAGVPERSQSRASGTRVTGTTLDDAERDELENRVAELRDKNNHLKLQNQDLQRELDACQQDFETAVEGKMRAEELIAGLQDELENTTKDMMALQAERDETLQEHANLEGEFRALQKEAQDEINALEADVDKRDAEIERLQVELAEHVENFEALKAEMVKLSDAIVGLEDEQEAKQRTLDKLDQDLNDAHKEVEDLRAQLTKANEKANLLTVQQESSQTEIAFLREEQESDKIRIGDLEAAVVTAEQSLRDAKDRIRELEQRLTTERTQREIVANREKEEVQQTVNELNRELSAAMDEVRSLRKALSDRGVEAAKWKERLIELENNLREALGDLNGTRSSLLKVCCWSCWIG